MSDFLDLQGAKDLNTDAIHIGAVANSKDQVTGAAIDTHVNREGGTDYTLQGFWNALGPVVMPWTSVTGGTLTQPNQAFLHPANGNYYSWGGAYPVGGYVVAPGTDPAAVAGFVMRSDVTLRSQLAANDGASLVGSMSYAQLRAYTGANTTANVWGITSIFDGASGTYKVKSSDTTSTDNGGTILVDSTGRRWHRVFTGEINAAWFGAVGDNATDNAIALQSAINYTISCKSSLYIPTGTYLVSAGLVVTTSGGRSVSIRGEGMGLTNIKQTGGGFTILNVYSGQSWSSQSVKISDLSLTGLDKTVAANVGFNLGTASGTSLELSNIGVSGCYCGFALCGSQFNKFNHLTANGNTVGLYLYTTESSQGSNNNYFNSYYAQGNAVGLMLYNGGSGELQSNWFDNLATHAGMCGVYIYGSTGNNTFTNWAPEQNGNIDNWPTSSTIYSATVKAGALQLDNKAHLSLVNCFPFTTSLANVYLYSGRMYLTNSSTLVISKSSIQGLNIEKDVTSSVEVDQSYGNGTISDTLYPPFTKAKFNSFLNKLSFSVEDVSTTKTDVINLAVAYGNPLVGYSSGGTNCTYSLATDQTFGVVSSFSFASTAQQAIVNINPGSTAVGDSCVTAFNVKATKSGLFTFDSMQSTATLKVYLIAGKWTRVVLCGTTSTTPRGGHLRITAYDSTGVNNILYFCNLQSCLNSTKTDMLRVINGEVSHGTYSDTYQATEIPTFGTWVAGNVIFNATPASGGYVGWVCTVSGTPGTWKGFGLIE